MTHRFFGFGTPADFDNSTVNNETETNYDSTDTDTPIDETSDITTDMPTETTTYTTREDNTDETTELVTTQAIDTHHINVDVNSSDVEQIRRVGINESKIKLVSNNLLFSI